MEERGQPVAAPTCATPEPELDQTSIFIDFILCAFLLSFSFFPALCAYVFLPLLSCRISHGSKYVERGNEPRLVIDNVTYEYQGEYECRATSYINGQERVAISDPVSLQVVGKSVCACQCVQLCFMYMLLRLSWPGGGQGEEEGEQGVVCHKVATPQNMTATATVAKAEAEPTMAVKKVSSEKR